jgi:hypothetical protein
MVILSVVVPSFLTRRTDKQIRKREEEKKRETAFSMIFYENN